jgi:hypothetical protein
MLIGKDLKVIKGEKGTATQYLEYDRVYLEYGPGDTLEAFSKTDSGKPIQINGKEWQGTHPAEKVSKAPVKDLIEQATNYLQARFPTSNPFLTLLEAASKQADLWTRNEMDLAYRSPKPVDKDAVILKFANSLMKMNPKLTLEKALAKAKIAAEEDN